MIFLYVYKLGDENHSWLPNENFTELGPSLISIILLSNEQLQVLFKIGSLSELEGKMTNIKSKRIYKKSNKNLSKLESSLANVSISTCLTALMRTYCIYLFMPIQFFKLICALAHIHSLTKYTYFVYVYCR